MLWETFNGVNATVGIFLHSSPIFCEMKTEQSKEFRLIEEILTLSISEQWEEARQEWCLADIYREDEPQTCLCSHAPIIEICVLQNKYNGNVAAVGNVCVNKFLGIESESIFLGLRRISKDDNKALNSAAAMYAYKQGWINGWEMKFCLDTKRRRSISGKQKSKRRQINLRVLSKVTNTFRNREVLNNQS